MCVGILGVNAKTINIIMCAPSTHKGVGKDVEVGAGLSKSAGTVSGGEFGREVRETKRISRILLKD